MLIKKKKGRERAGGRREEERRTVPLDPFRVISLGEGVGKGRGGRRKLSDAGKSILSWEAP